VIILYFEMIFVDNDIATCDMKSFSLVSQIFCKFKKE